MKYVGIDVHKKMCQAAVLEEDGELLEHIRFANLMWNRPGPLASRTFSIGAVMMLVNTIMYQKNDVLKLMNHPLNMLSYLTCKG